MFLCLAAQVLVSLAGCGGHAPVTMARSAVTEHYRLVSSVPKRARKGKSVVATFRVTPVAPYKINLEYATRLSLSAPEGITPRSMAINGAGAAIHSTAEILIKPRFTAHTVGDHRFSGELRFSVCTDELCDLEKLPVTWVTAVTE